MKRRLLSLAIGAAVAGASTLTIAEPTVYGKINASLERVDDDNDTKGDFWELKSNASRLGVKGSEKISGQLEGIYQLEFEVDTTDNSKGSTDNIKSRDQFAGLKSSQLGTVKVGRMNTPFKDSQADVDLFNDLSPDLKSVMTGEVRANNTIQYVSPKISDMITLKLAIVPGEKAIDNKNSRQDGIADSYSFSADYNKDGLYLAIANDGNMNTSLAGVATTPVALTGPSGNGYYDETRLVAQYSKEPFQVGFIWETAEESDLSTKSIDSWLLSGAYKMQAFTFKGQYQAATQDGATSGANSIDLAQWTLGVDYALAKPTKVYGYYSQYDKDNGTSDPKKTIFALGIEQKF
jgi:predicted porin